MDPTGLTVIDTAASIREGRFTSEECVRALIERANEHSGLNAFIALDADQALSAARAADRSEGGALHGVPIVLKDNIDTVSLPTTAGTPALARHRPRSNAPVAQALIDAGAIVLGKTNMHELAFGITNNNASFGPARNPWNPALIPGGSSGGTAVAVAARLAPGGLGTDTGGSVRIPAALCGIVGFRPTTGRHSQESIVPISNTRDTAGPMVRSVADAVLLDGLVAGGETALATATFRGLKLGVARDPFFVDLDPEVERLMERELMRLRDHGVELVEFDAPEIQEHVKAAGFPIALYETVSTLDSYLGNSGISVEELFEATASPDVHGLLTGLLGDQAIPRDIYLEAIHTHRPALQSAMARCFAEHRVSALVFPTTPLPARPVGQDETVELCGSQVPTFPAYIRNTDPGSVAGLPGLTLPVGLTEDGLPVGIELDGPAGSDHALLSVGLGYENILEPMPSPLP